MEGFVDILTSEHRDAIEFMRTEVLGGTRLATYEGRDLLVVGDEHPGRCVFNGLAASLGEDMDTVWLSDMHNWARTTISLGKGEELLEQQVFIAPGGDVTTGTLAIGADGATSVEFTPIVAGIYHVTVTDSLFIDLTDSDRASRVHVRDADVTGPSTIRTGAADDTVTVTDARFDGHLEVGLREGDDQCFIGYTPAGHEPVSVTGDLLVDGSAGRDEVTISSVLVGRDTSIYLSGNETPDFQFLSLGQFGGYFSCRNLFVGGDGPTAVRIGSAGTTPTVWIRRRLRIHFEHNSANTNVLIQNTIVSGRTDIETGAGADVVAIHRSAFFGRTGIKLGGGDDIFGAASSAFTSFKMAGNAGDDTFVLVGNQFWGPLGLDGGSQVLEDVVNDNFYTANWFRLRRPRVVNIEAFRPF
jgi:hypothetical protein